MKGGAPEVLLDARTGFQDLLRAESLPDSYAFTIEEVLVPLAGLITHRHRQLQRCVTVGICGPQESGKSTAVRVLQRIFDANGLRAASLSLDDLYLTRHERESLAMQVHPLLLTRGPPGTHDVRLGERILRDLVAGRTVRLPRFSKAIDDRIREEDWELIDPRADIILFEGWCVGARPQADAELAKPVNRLEAEEDPSAIWRRYVNDALASYSRLFAALDLLIPFVSPDFETVIAWREEQEEKLRKRSAGEAGSRVMTARQVRRFVAHYERLTRHILQEMPHRADAVVRLSADRTPTELCLRSARYVPGDQPLGRPRPS
jgi:D-glycerate 3-kinase